MLQTNEVPNRLIEEVAYFCWMKRGQPWANDPNRDIDEARQIINKHWRRLQMASSVRGEEIIWRDWCGMKMRPYIAVEAGEAPQEVSDDLRKKSQGAETETNGVFLTLVLDGSPERSRYLYRKHANNGVKPEILAERKDAFFCSLSASVLSQFATTSYAHTELHALANDISARPFQDGLAIAFGSPETTTDAISGLLKLRRRLAEYNEEKGLLWRECLHIRATIGSTWYNSVGLVRRRTCRDCIVVDSCLLESLDRRTRAILLAAGILPALPIRIERGSSNESGEFPEE